LDPAFGPVLHSPTLGPAWAKEQAQKGLNETRAILYQLRSIREIQLVGALVIAQLLTRKLRGVNLARSLVYLPAVISGPAGGLIWRFMLGKQTGIFNYFLSFFGVKPIPWIDDPHYALFSIICIGLWAVGQPMILFLAALQGVPTVFYEAAEVDGASATRKFFRITLPMISPTILLNVIIIMINQFQMLAPLIVITSGGPAKATYWGALLAASALSVLFPVVLFFVLQKYLFGGLVLSGIKA
jgi:ABC-type sugar transport system permease subunit